jgi:hypothetical protein
MIWDPETRFCPEPSPAFSRIAGEIAAVCGPDVDIDSGNIQELARAVEVFMRQENENVCSDSEYIVMLACRALSSIGEGPAARRLLVFGTGLVEPSEWEVTGEEAIWAIDLKQMTIRDDSLIELVFFSSLNIVIEYMAGVWDETAGRGVLGLRHVCCTAEALLGGARNKPEIEKLAREIRAACVQRLEQLRDARGWKDAPFVMNLDV